MTIREEPMPDVQRALRSLKDFQRRSVEYIFDQLYKRDRTRRFLLADEVGLGKTLVAKGVIARAIKHLWKTIDRIDVVYICSNADIARQNVNRLQIPGQKDFVLASRLTLLPTSISDMRDNKINFVALTPGTSFSLKSSMGVAKERVLLYWLLKRAWRLGNKTAPKNVMRGNMNARAFRNRLQEFNPRTEIDATLARAFIDDLKAHDRRMAELGEPALRRQFGQLCRQFQRVRKNIPREQRVARAKLVGELRALLATTCITALEPDLIILDEFQRFKHLLKGESDAGNLARNLFEWEEARVLLLSATPYKMYTSRDDGSDDDHYRDFRDTLRFLFDDDAALAQLDQTLHAYRSGLYRLAAGDGDHLQQCRDDLERQLRRVIARTERLAVTEDRSGMLSEQAAPDLALDRNDVGAFLHTQSISNTLETGRMVEYWKSAPYLLNFMDNYTFKREFDRNRNRTDVQAAVRNGNHLLLPWRMIERFQPVASNNARLRSLMHQTVSSGAWRMLWMPPTLPYYEPAGPFAGDAARQFTKRLVFSSWQVVPKAVSTLVSYEAERQMMLSFDPQAANTVTARSRIRGLLQLSLSQGRLTGMPVLGLFYPSFTLAKAADPLQLMGRHGRDQQLTADEAEDYAASVLKTDIEELTRSAPQTGPVDEAWYWAAPILLDLKQKPSKVRDWFESDECWPSPRGDDDDDDVGWWRHFDEAATLVHGERDALGRAPDDLLEVVAQLAVAGPGVVALRALSRVTGGSGRLVDHTIRGFAAQMAWALRDLFNLPDVMAVVRGLNRAEPYWRRVLEYCRDGCLQSTLDEYVHMLHESLGLNDVHAAKCAEQIAGAIASAVGLRIATPGVDDIRVPSSGGPIRIEKRTMRARFAMRFGDEAYDETGERQRADQVRQAFNSPFWPFVLVTTSVGQEGLDFHSYCHAVVHWNLPSNPVDLEQREGRVHRYKGHAVRKNVAADYRDAILANHGADPWERLFALACKRTDRVSDLDPFWVYPRQGGATIERYILALPLSRESDLVPALRRSLALYRMVFGQPRQDDLIEYLKAHLPPDSQNEVLDRFRIDLSPPAKIGRSTSRTR